MPLAPERAEGRKVVSQVLRPGPVGAPKVQQSQSQSVGHRLTHLPWLIHC